MVNNGSSGACDACKQRRKKCDETRPSCLRCSRAHRQCPGYVTNKDLKFVNYAGGADRIFLHQKSVGLLHPSTQTNMLDWSNIEQNARLEFFTDYCIVSSNQRISRGYLNGLQTMTLEAGPTSELTKACTILALANLGKKIRSPILIQTAENSHSLLLQSFRLSISNSVTGASVQSLITAVLLGLYEIMTSSEAHYSAHIVHARGVSAILNSDSSPFNLMCDGKLFKVARPFSPEDLEIDGLGLPSVQSSPARNIEISPRFSILCTQLNMTPSLTMEEAFAQATSLILKGRLLLASEPTPDQLFNLKLDAEQLKQRYDLWLGSLSEEWRPRSVGVISINQEENGPPVGYWPGTILSYYDPYVASTLNSYRKSRLLILNIIIDCHHRIDTSAQDMEIDTLNHEEAKELIESIVSSIPFLLVADLQEFLENAMTGTPSIVPGRPVGGLVLIHTLFVLLTLPMVDSKLKGYIKSCLVWIGDHMGIGQATILSKCTTSDMLEYITEAHVVIWAGMLI